MADTRKALAAAVAAIYFGDSSDYLSALHEVVSALDPVMAKLLETNERAAFEATHPEEGSRGTEA